VSSLTYVYCLVLNARRPIIPPGLQDVPGGRDVRALAAGDGVWLIVTTVPAKTYDEAALAKGLQNLDWVGRRALAHEAVVEQFLSSRSILPMQLFTLFTSDERALQHVGRQRNTIVGILKRLERKLEWGLRLTFDEAALRTGIEAKARKAAGPVPSGAGYLARKRDLLDVTRGQLSAARTEANRLFAKLKARPVPVQSPDPRPPERVSVETDEPALTLDGPKADPPGRVQDTRRRGSILPDLRTAPASEAPPQVTEQRTASRRPRSAQQKRITTSPPSGEVEEQMATDPVVTPPSEPVLDEPGPSDQPEVVAVQQPTAPAATANGGSATPRRFGRALDQSWVYRAACRKAKRRGEPLPARAAPRRKRA